MQFITTRSLHTLLFEGPPQNTNYIQWAHSIGSTVGVIRTYALPGVFTRVFDGVTRILARVVEGLAHLFSRAVIRVTSGNAECGDHRKQQQVVNFHLEHLPDLDYFQLLLYRGPPPAGDKHDDREDQPYDKEDPGNVCSRTGYSAEAENTSYQRDD
jgi:hypothetical protein